LPGAAGTRQGILCVFGIGDGTALDLRALLDRFHEVHIVDSDETRLRQAIRRQDLDDRQRIFHQQHEMTGVDRLWDTFRRQPGTLSADDMCRRIAAHEFADLGQFDVVLSVCRIPELTAPAARCVDDDAGQAARLVKAIRDRHLELLLRHTIPGGLVVLVIDVVSSRTLPALTRHPEDPGRLLTEAVQQGNFFPGAHPAAVDRWLAARRERLERIDVSRPWIHETLDDLRLAVAFRVRLRDAGPPA
jgi:hypothetical protein